MAQAADIPIIGGVLHSLGVYLGQSVRILRHPFGFAQNIDFEDRAEAKRAWEFIFAGIIVTYLAFIPSFLKHESDISQSLFIISQFLRIALLIAVIHLMLSVLGSRKPLRATFVAYCYTAGLFMPIIALIALPAMMAVGPEIALGKIDPSVHIENYIGPNERWLMNMSSILFFVVGLVVISVTLVWLSRIHQLSRLRTASAFVAGLTINLAIFQYVFLPLWNRIEGWLLSILRFL